MRTRLNTTLLLIALCIPAQAEWVCREQASITQGPRNILACGVGIADSESSARELAFYNAVREFDALCGNTKDCDPKNVVSRPKRTECEEQGGQHTCYRAVEYNLEPPKKTRDRNVGNTRLSLGIRFHQNRFEQMQVGYTAQVAYCLVSYLCPLAGVSFGKLKEDEFFTGSFAQGFVGLKSFVFDKWYVSAILGVEKLSGNVETQNTTFSGNIGVDAITVESVSITIEAGAVNSGKQTNSRIGLFGTLRF